MASVGIGLREVYPAFTLMASAFDILDDPPLEVRGPLQRWTTAREQADDPRTAVVRASWGAATVGEAFFAGYQGALETLLGSVGSNALLVTEMSGQHPKNLKTVIRGNRVTGSKAFAMTDVDAWWVLAVAGPRDLRLARVAPEQPGIQVAPLHTSFVADVPHGSVTFDGAVVDQVIDDAWDRVVRPFRAADDGGVLLGLATALVGAVVDPADQDLLLGHVAALLQLFGHTDDGSFRALMGVREQLVRVADRARLQGPLAASWSDWRPLVQIAQKARTTRLQRARERTRFDAS